MKNDSTLTNLLAGQAEVAYVWRGSKFGNNIRQLIRVAGGLYGRF